MLLPLALLSIAWARSGWTGGLTPLQPFWYQGPLLREPVLFWSYLRNLHGITDISGFCKGISCAGDTELCLLQIGLPTALLKGDWVSESAAQASLASRL